MDEDDAVRMMYQGVKGKITDEAKDIMFDILEVFLLDEGYRNVSIELRKRLDIINGVS